MILDCAEFSIEVEEVTQIITDVVIAFVGGKILTNRKLDIVDNKVIERWF